MRRGASLPSPSREKENDSCSKVPKGQGASCCPQPLLSLQPQQVGRSEWQDPSSAWLQGPSVNHGAQKKQNGGRRAPKEGRSKEESDQPIPW